MQNYLVSVEANDYLVYADESIYLKNRHIYTAFDPKGLFTEDGVSLHDAIMAEFGKQVAIGNENYA